MARRTGIMCLSALAIALVLSISSLNAIAAGWNHTYPDPEGDVTLASVDITRIRSYSEGTDVILEMILRGNVENDTETVYSIHVGSQSADVGFTWTDGNGVIDYYGSQGSDTQNISVSGNVISARLPQAHAGPENQFDIYGYAVHTVQATVYYDWSGPGYQGGGEINPGQILGMALWVCALAVIIPVIVVILIIVIVLGRKKKAPQQPPMQQPPYPPQQQYPQPPQQYQQYTPPQQPPQQSQPKPPGK